MHSANQMWSICWTQDWVTSPGLARVQHLAKDPLGREHTHTRRTDSALLFFLASTYFRFIHSAWSCPRGSNTSLPRWPWHAIEPMTCPLQDRARERHQSKRDRERERHQSKRARGRNREPEQEGGRRGGRRERETYIYICIYVYIYICIYINIYNIYLYMCCEVIIWAKFGHFRCYYLGQVGVIIWAKFFLAYKNSGFKRFLHTHLSFSVFFVPNYLAVI